MAQDRRGEFSLCCLVHIASRSTPLASYGHSPAVIINTTPHKRLLSIFSDRIDSNEIVDNSTVAI